MKQLCIAPIVLLATLIAACIGTVANGQDLNGAWRGTLCVGPMSLNVVLNLEQTEQGLTATLDSPDQNAKGIPATASIDGDKLTVNVAMLGAKYVATVDDGILDGTFSQSGQSFPLKLTRKLGGEIDRPQEAAIEADPNKPYRDEEVTFVNGPVTLAGTLTLPKQGNHFPAVVLVSGTGPNDRDETILRHKPFLLLADALARKGIAVLRYDKRGVGGSTAGSADDTAEELASDALAALHYLQTRTEVNASQVGMLGHSEGGLIAFMNAAQHGNDVAFVVSMAGPAVKGRDLMIEQNRLIAGAMGTTLPDGELKQIEAIFDLIDKSDDAASLRASLQQITAGNAAWAAQVDALCSPAYRWLIKCDPTQWLRQVKCPMLALNGTLDSQVACEINLKAIERLVPHATVKRYDRLNHLFQTCDGWTTSLHYAAIQETLAPQVLTDITDWIQHILR